MLKNVKKTILGLSLLLAGIAYSFADPPVIKPEEYLARNYYNEYTVPGGTIVSCTPGPALECFILDGDIYQTEF